MWKKYICLQAILEMEGVDTSEFTDEVLACLPPTPWHISPEEIGKRRDLRSLRFLPLACKRCDHSILSRN